MEEVKYIKVLNGGSVTNDNRLCPSQFSKYKRSDGDKGRFQAMRRSEQRAINVSDFLFTPLLATYRGII